MILQLPYCFVFHFMNAKVLQMLMQLPNYFSCLEMFCAFALSANANGLMSLLSDDRLFHLFKSISNRIEIAHHL